MREVVAGKQQQAPYFFYVRAHRYITDPFLYCNDMVVGEETLWRHISLSSTSKQIYAKLKVKQIIEKC